MILPLGIPPSPNAISKLKEPVGMVSTFICAVGSRLHYRALSVLLLDLAQRRIQCFKLIVFFHVNLLFVQGTNVLLFI